MPKGINISLQVSKVLSLYPREKIGWIVNANTLHKQVNHKTMNVIKRDYIGSRFDDVIDITRNSRIFLY